MGRSPEGGDTRRTESSEQPDHRTSLAAITDTWLTPSFTSQVPLDLTESGGGGRRRGEGVVVVVVVGFDANLQAECLCRQTLRTNCAGALDGKELFTIEGSENWRSTPDNVEERKNGLKRPKKNPSSSPQTPLLRADYPSLLRNVISTDSGDELNLWHFHCRNPTSLQDHRDVHNRR